MSVSYTHLLLHTALHREIRHIDPADENIVRAQVQRNGVALVPAADIEVRDEKIAALDVVGRTGARENIALRIEQERKLRPFRCVSETAVQHCH